MSRSVHRRPLAIALALAVGLMAVPAGAKHAAAAATFTVNSTGDAADLNLANFRCDTSTATGDQCTLRAAIQEANDTVGPDTIIFAIVSAPVLKTIAPLSPLPPITEAVTINGYTQAGASVNTLATGNNAVLRVQLNGINAGEGGPGSGPVGLQIDGSGSIVRGLVINRFSGHGVVVTGSGNEIKGNLIGTNALGNTALGNGRGVAITGPDNVVGGTTPAARNLISGSETDGVFIAGGDATGNRVQGNYIGTDKGGTSALGNGFVGVTISEAPGTIVGGRATGAGNVISGNIDSGVRLFGLSAGNGAVIQGNFIGTDATGALDVGNGSDGVFVAGGATGAVVGGTVPGARNVISGNGADGIHVSASETLVQGNFIGTDATGTVALGNDDNGVYVEFQDNTIGGTVSGAGNLISGNGRSGVLIFTQTGTADHVLGNRIGTKADGTGDLGNVLDGVELNVAASIVSGNVISGNGRVGVRIGGGFATGNVIAANVIKTNDSHGASVEIGPNIVAGGNLIVQNGGHGVRVSAVATGVRIFPNQIIGNAGLGINLIGGNENGFGVTSNDSDDPDTGANDRQNFPVITSAIRSNANGVTTVLGSLNSNPSQTFTIALFLADGDPSGHGEAQVPIGNVTVTTNAGGDTGFAFGHAGLSVGHVLTATATNTATKNTSEFSLNRQIVAAP